MNRFNIRINTSFIILNNSIDKFFHDNTIRYVGGKMFGIRLYKMNKG